MTSEKNDDNKSFVNPKTNDLSKAYEEFVNPIGRGLFDEKYWFPEENIDCCPQALIYTSTSSRYRNVSIPFPCQYYASSLLEDYSSPVVLFLPNLNGHRKTKPKPPSPTSCGPASAMNSQNSASTASGTDHLALIRLACSRSTS